MGNSGQTVRLRIVVAEPPPGVAFALQEGASGLVPPSEIAAERLTFECDLNVADTKSVPVRLTGPFAQGPASARFIYVCSGVRAGQVGSSWERRAKVPLAGISSELLARALSERRALEAAIHGLAKDGGPACASVKLLSGWRLA
jgi:hypothetical protein